MFWKNVALSLIFLLVTIELPESLPGLIALIAGTIFGVNAVVILTKEWNKK